MYNCRYMVILSCFVMLICCSMGWATAYEDDSQVESDAQKDMLAYVQSTFPYRFGSDLQAGDYVQYEIVDHHSEREEPELCSLKVTERNDNIATIMEEFEGNILYYRIDLHNNTLLEYWEFDEDGMEQRPLLLTSSEVETRMLTMKNQNNRLCNPNLSEGITPEIRQAVQELTKVYFSETVPKLLPAKLMAVYLDNPEVFEGNAGLVKQSKYQIKDYNRVNR